MTPTMAAIVSVQATAGLLDARVSVAIYDAGGRCLGSARMDEGSWLSEEEARATALACVSLGMDTEKISKLRGQLWIENIFARRSDIGITGTGVLILSNGRVLGAVAVCGGTDKIDYICACRGAGIFAHSVAANNRDNEVNQESFRQAMGCFQTGVTVVTTFDEATEQPRGFTANSLVSLSQEPPLVGVLVGRSTKSYTAFVSCKGFAISILQAHQEKLAVELSRSGPNKFKGGGMSASPSNYLTVNGALVQFECKTEGVVELGDHVLVWGQMVWTSEVAEKGSPLTFMGSGSFNSV